MYRRCTAGQLEVAGSRDGQTYFRDALWWTKSRAPVVGVRPSRCRHAVAVDHYRLLALYHRGAWPIRVYRSTAAGTARAAGDYGRTGGRAARRRHRIQPIQHEHHSRKRALRLVEVLHLLRRSRYTYLPRGRLRTDVEVWMNEWMNEFVFAHLIETYREGAVSVCPSYACLYSSVLSLLQKPVNVRVRSGREQSVATSSRSKGRK